jgi:hypothetical protein
MRDQCLELARRIGRDPDDVVECWSERAAIREVDGGQRRADAERDAFEDVRAMFEPTPISALSGDRRGPRAAVAAAPATQPTVAGAQREDK